MKSIKIEETKNGYTVDVSGFIKASGRYVYKATETITMLEFIGELVSSRKVEVREK